MDNLTFDPSVFQYDELKLFYKEPYKVNDYIIISQPSIQDIIEYGEREYYQTVGLLCSTPSDMKVVLWDEGKDWNKISEFELFTWFIGSLPPEQTGILFGDLDFRKFLKVQKKDTGELALYDPEHDWLIDDLIYHKMVSYLRKIHEMSYKPMKVKGKQAKLAIIMRDRARMGYEKDKPYESQLKNLISAMLVYPGFKYNKNELRDCGIYEFMDAVKRSQLFVSTSALFNGAYSGMLDTSKINNKEFNWLRDMNS